MRFYLVDKVVSVNLGDSIEGIKCITKSEDFLEQHFPGYPVMPGVLIIESMAQLSGYLLSKSKAEQGQYIFALLSMVEKAKFYSFACPGDRIKISAKIESQREDSSIVKAKAFIEEQKIAEVRMMFVHFPVEGKSDEEKKELQNKVFAGMENNSNPFLRGQLYV